METLPPLTHLEARVLAAIERHIRSEGMAPTIAELAGNLRLKSKGTVHRYVQSLISKGRLEREGNGWRGLRIVGLTMPHRPTNVQHLPVRPAAQNLVTNADKSVKNLLPHLADADHAGVLPGAIKYHAALTQNIDPAENGQSSTSIPLLGKIAAGQPIEAIEDTNYLDLAAFFLGPDRYALRVTGDSMMDAGILDGDTVILKKQSTARPGDIVVALIDAQEATLKRLGSVKGGLVELVPENSAMTTMLYAESRVRFQGVLIGQMRSY